MPKCADLEIRPICHECHRTISISTVDPCLNLFKPPKDVFVRKAKDVILAATDDGYLRFDFFEKRHGARMEASMVRHEEDITAKIGIGSQEARF